METKTPPKPDFSVRLVSFFVILIKMAAEEINMSNSSAVRKSPAHNRNILVTLSLGFLTVASILLLVYQANRATQLRIEAAEVWSDYQTRGTKAAIEEDPNLKAQYSEEQEMLRKHAVQLRETSKSANDAARLSGFSSLLFLLGTTAAVIALIGRSVYLIYAGLVLGIIAVVLAFKAAL